MARFRLYFKNRAFRIFWGVGCEKKRENKADHRVSLSVWFMLDLLLRRMLGREMGWDLGWGEGRVDTPLALGNLSRQFWIQKEGLAANRNVESTSLLMALRALAQAEPLRSEYRRRGGQSPEALKLRGTSKRPKLSMVWTKTSLRRTASLKPTEKSFKGLLD